MLVTLLGTTTDLMLKQPENAYASMILRLSGRTISVIFEQVPNAFSPISATLEPKLTLVRPLQK